MAEVRGGLGWWAAGHCSKGRGTRRSRPPRVPPAFGLTPEQALHVFLRLTSPRTTVEVASVMTPILQMRELIHTEYLSQGSAGQSPSLWPWCPRPRYRALPESLRPTQRFVHM